MGLLDHLGFEFKERNAFHRGMSRFVSTPIGSWFGKWLVPFLDRLVFRITDGGNTAVGWLAGLPMIWLTTKGRRTGKLRRSPLLAFPFEDDLAIIGSNFGQAHHPGWALNLESQSEAELEHKEHTLPVQVRRAVEHEIDRIWEAAAHWYPGYRRYRNVVTGREIKLFILQHRS